MPGGGGGMPGGGDLAQLMQQFGGMGGGGAPAQQFVKPVHNEVYKVTSLAVIQKVIKDTPGVIIDFWSPTCPPCMRFKPVFEGMARNNTNKSIIFAAC